MLTRLFFFHVFGPRLFGLLAPLDLFPFLGVFLLMYPFSVYFIYNSLGGDEGSSLVGIVFANGPEDHGSIPGQVIPKTQKWYLMPPCLTLSTIK